jgi:V-type H+-transporting ATPase subunit a
LFGQSCYNIDEARQTGAKELRPISSDCIYQVGVDPAWYLAKNELSYMNSLKMKNAVILGVAQMTLGVILKGFNYLRAKKMVDFWFEFLPQLIMLLALFGFMDLLIVVKWLTDYSS